MRARNPGARNLTHQPRRLARSRTRAAAPSTDRPSTPPPAPDAPAARSPPTLRSSGRCCGLRGITALGPHATQHALASVLLETGVQAPDLCEDLVGDGLLLLAGGLADALPAQRLAVLDGDLGEFEPLPVADPRGSVDRDRHDRRAGLQ